MMKKIMLIASLILLFFLSTPTAKSPFVDLPYKSYIEPKEMIEEKIGILATSHTCYVPPWTECPDGYECVDYSFMWLYPLGKKFGWTCDGGLTTDSGMHNYKIRIVMDLAILHWYTVTSKVLFNGTYIVNVTPSNNIITIGSSLDFNYSHPGLGFVFEPSYAYGEYVNYLDCAIMWLNFSQSDAVNISIPILYKTYITDLNRDSTNKTDIYDAIILSNEYGNSWDLPIDPNDYTWRADINSDGIINTLDAIILKNQFGTNYIKPEFEWTLLNIWEPMWENTLDCWF